MCFRCEVCFQAQCREIRVEERWLEVGKAEPVTEIYMTGGEPDREVIIRWEFLFDYYNYEDRGWVHADYGKVPMRSVPISVRSPGCEAFYCGEPIGQRFSHGKYKSLCHMCYVKLLVCASVPSLVNLCVAELFQGFVDNALTVEKRQWVNTPKLFLLFRQYLRQQSKRKTKLVHPVLRNALVDISHRIELQYDRFGKAGGGGNDYTAASGHQRAIPLPTLCIGSPQCASGHYTIYPSFMLQVKDWRYYAHHTARFQCVHCRNLEEELFPKHLAVINFISTEIGYGYGLFDPIFKQ